MTEYNRKNRRKYSLKVHIVLVTKYRNPILVSLISDCIKRKIHDLSNRMGWKIIAMETDVDHIHLLLDYDTTESVCNMVKTIKQETTYLLWKEFETFLTKRYWKRRIFWSDGYFACSVGDASAEIIKQYIAKQG